jgi:hypothetical protein
MSSKDSIWIRGFWVQRFWVQRFRVQRFRVQRFRVLDFPPAHFRLLRRSFIKATRLTKMEFSSEPGLIIDI